jgi:hypothetical protein
MKKYIYLAAILSFILSSCSPEKEEPIPPVAQSQYPVGSVFGDKGPTIVLDVTNPKTGKTWMDRNLGATRAATSSTDVESYGDLYQWGRRADGHQIRTSLTTPTLSSSDQPVNGNFITVNSVKLDWRSPQNDNLWQGVARVNNPCPSGYRIPTEAEWEAERLSWSANSSVGAFASPLLLPVAGARDDFDGLLYGVGAVAYYWSSTVSGADSRKLVINKSDAEVSSSSRAYGYSVRCIKN